MKIPVAIFPAAISWFYLLILLVWLIFYLAIGDRLPYLSALNFIAPYLFLPLPLVILANLFMRRWDLWIGATLGVAAFVWLWGGQFLPRPARVQASPPDGGVLVVMTYNVLGRHNRTSPQIETVRRANPDVVFLQELNLQLARALQDELGGEYPHQVLDPVAGVTGMGVISKYPLRITGESMPLEWVGVPQVLEMAWNDHLVTLVNFHMVPTTRSNPEVINATNRRREAQARVLADFAHQAGPVIVAGDANANPLSDSYKILTSTLQDAWRQAGFGFGHTFPGSDLAGSSRPRIGRWLVPRWMARIDYIFHSSHWVTLEARLASFDGVSDHRGVIAILARK